MTETYEKEKKQDFGLSVAFILAAGHLRGSVSTLHIHKDDMLPG